VKISGIFFAIVILAFFLPFMVVKCADQDMASVSGFKLAFGGKVNTEKFDDMVDGMSSSFSDFTDHYSEEDMEELAEEDLEMQTEADEKDKLKVNGWALIALLAAVAGLISALIMNVGSYMIPLIAAIVGFITMLFIKAGLMAQMKMPMQEAADMIKVSPRWGWWVALIGFIIAGILAFIYGSKKGAKYKEQISKVIPDEVEGAVNRFGDSVEKAGAGVAGAVGGAYDKVKDKIEESDIDDKFRDTVDKAKDKFDDTVNKVRDRFDRDDAGEKVEEAKEKVDEIAQDFKEKVEETKEKVDADIIEQKIDQMADKAKENIEEVAEKIKEGAEEGKEIADEAKKKLEE
jgi:hypothetical protein